MTTTFFLQDEMFRYKERTLVEANRVTASAFRFASGVAALRLRNDLGEVVLLPYQGQQVWSAAFRGRNITMRSMFDQPRPTRNYLETYGGFNLHCGFTSMGVPAAGDTHPLHGELPNAPYDEAWIVVGSDERGDYVGLGGRYRHTVAFSYNYVAEPMVKLYANSSVFAIEMAITNLKRTPMDYMYMAHVNFRPVDNGRLVYSAVATPAHVRVRSSIPSHVRPGPGFREFLDSLAKKPDARPGRAGHVPAVDRRAGGPQRRKSQRQCQEPGRWRDLALPVRVWRADRGRGAQDGEGDGRDRREGEVGIDRGFDG